MQLYMDFSVILGGATLVCALIWGIDALFFRKNRVVEPKLVEYARSFFPILLAVFVLRAFIIEPFRIPSGSMKPPLKEGDFILVNKYTYGLRLPLFATKLVKLNNPQRGDVLVFRYPVDPSIDFIKRVIGVPGDKIAYKNKVVYLNGKPLDQEFLGTMVDNNPGGYSIPVKHYKEMLPGRPHSIYLNARPSQDLEEQVVPEGMYFVMGDNRDNSEDSRVWGFVPDKLILGKAIYIWLSWDSSAWDVRWNRIGKKIE